MKTFKSYVVSEGYYNSLKQYMTGDGQLSSFGEYVVMQHGDVNLIKAYMKFYSLRPASHLTLFELSEGLGTELIESGCTIAEDALEYLLKQKKFLAISEYIRHNPLHSAGIYPKLEIMLLKHAPDWLIKQYIHLHCFYAEAQMELMSLPSSVSGLPQRRLFGCSDIQQFLYQHSPMSAPLTDHFSFCVNSPTSDFITRSVEYLLKPARYCSVFSSSILLKLIL